MGGVSPYLGEEIGGCMCCTRECVGELLKALEGMQCRCGTVRFTEEQRNNSYHMEDRTYIPRFTSVTSERPSCLMGESSDVLLKSSGQKSNHGG